MIRTPVHTLHILQHVPFEAPGRILDWAQKHRIATPHYNLYAGDYPPAPGPGEAVCVLGGPMNILGRSLGLQFHLEAGSPECSRMIHHCGAELVQLAPTIHSAEAIRVQAEEHAPRAAAVLHKLLDWHCRAYG